MRKAPRYTNRQFSILTSALGEDPAELQRLNNLNFGLGNNLTDQEREEDMSMGYPMAIRINPDFAMQRMQDRMLAQQDTAGTTARFSSQAMDRELLEKMVGNDKLSYLVNNIRQSQNPFDVVEMFRSQPELKDGYNALLESMTPDTMINLFAANGAAGFDRAKALRMAAEMEAHANTLTDSALKSKINANAAAMKRLVRSVAMNNIRSVPTGGAMPLFR